MIMFNLKVHTGARPTFVPVQASAALYVGEQDSPGHTTLLSDVSAQALRPLDDGAELRHRNSIIELDRRRAV